ncbi:MAG: hypothetical protein HY651_11100 [Acidobacteria bacterium]|nr:hypothetical protein [Acidobacteriota bacterium]
MGKMKDIELQQVMAEEGSRGSRHPGKAEALERKRRLRRAAEMLANKECEKRDYLSVLREDFGLKDESAEFLQYEKWWQKYRGEF